MIQEKPATYYDEFFEHEVAYKVHYRKSFYYVHWTQVIVFLGKIKQPRILEIGCGTGQLAEYLYDEHLAENYRGFDFSKKAIEIARQRVPLNFVQGDALQSNNYTGNYNTVVCLEVLEHIQNDLEVLSHIPVSTNIIFSVPNFDAPSHVRWFISERQIKKRYFKFIDIAEIVRVGNIFICRGVISPFRPSALQRFLATRENVNVTSFIKRIRHRLKNLLKSKNL